MVVALTGLGASLLLIVIVCLRQAQVIRALQLDVEGLQLVTGDLVDGSYERVGGVHTHEQASESLGLLSPGRPLPVLDDIDLPSKWSLMLIPKLGAEEDGLVADFWGLSATLGDSFALLNGHLGREAYASKHTIQLIPDSVPNEDFHLILMIDPASVVQGYGRVSSVDEVIDFVREGSEAGFGPAASARA